MPATVYWWFKAPFVRVLAALVVGILLQWHLHFSIHTIVLTSGICLMYLLLYYLLNVKVKFRYRTVAGVAMNTLIAAAGCWLVWKNDVRNQARWIGNASISRQHLLVTLTEPLIEKPNTYKALATVDASYVNGHFQPAKGKVLLYFKKQGSRPQLHYGSQILLGNVVQPIKNAGNPGGFNYQQYCLFQGITHQAFLSNASYRILPFEQKSAWRQQVFSWRGQVVNVLRRYIKGSKQQGLAEALLIGYKDDLDKNLVQAYSNTGVVHIIAISGLHLGIIYWMLLLLTRPVGAVKKLAWLRFLLVVAGLWLFTFIAGAQPSVTRSAVMFSCIALSGVLARRSHIYNTLAFSAFLLLCFNPFWLWDVGFQLSYAAVLSIIVFFRPVYNWIYCENKLLDFLWKLAAVTISAQVFTLPISIYHFHQAPVLFLFTNMLAVPLSSIILILEILLCAFSFFTTVAVWLGNLIGAGILFMNRFIEHLDSVSFSVWNQLYISPLQVVFLLASIAAFCFWLKEKQKHLLPAALICLLLFVTVRTASFFRATAQAKVIVYNVPKHQAIDVVVGRTLLFIGDDDLLADDFNRNFHLQPSRIMLRTNAVVQKLASKNFFFGNKHFLVVDTAFLYRPLLAAPAVDVLILSKNPRLNLHALIQNLNAKQVVIDASVPQYKIRLFKNICAGLGVPCFDVSQEGAFVFNI